MWHGGRCYAEILLASSADGAGVMYTHGYLPLQSKVVEADEVTEWAEAEQKVSENAFTAKRKHDAWTSAKFAGRVRLPADQMASLKPKDPPRMNFGTGAVQRAKESKPLLARSAAEWAILRGEPVKHVFESEDNASGLKASRQVLLKQGFVFEENFHDPEAGAGKDSIDRDLYERVKSSNAKRKQRKEGFETRQEVAQQLYDEWSTTKALSGKAVACLPYIQLPKTDPAVLEALALLDIPKQAAGGDCASLAGRSVADRVSVASGMQAKAGARGNVKTEVLASGALSVRTGLGMGGSRALASRGVVIPADARLEGPGAGLPEGVAAAAERTWLLVGRALKSVDINLLNEWVAWSEGFARPGLCISRWPDFSPSTGGTRDSGAAVRDRFIKMLKLKQTTFADAVQRYFSSKRGKSAHAKGLDAADLASVMAHAGLAVRDEEVERIVKAFDLDGNGRITNGEVQRMLSLDRSQGGGGSDEDEEAGGGDAGEEEGKRTGGRPPRPGLGVTSKVANVIDPEKSEVASWPLEKRKAALDELLSMSKTERAAAAVAERHAAGTPPGAPLLQQMKQVISHDDEDDRVTDACKRLRAAQERGVGGTSGSKGGSKREAGGKKGHKRKPSLAERMAQAPSDSDDYSDDDSDDLYSDDSDMASDVEDADDQAARDEAKDHKAADPETCIRLAYAPHASNSAPEDVLFFVVETCGPRGGVDHKSDTWATIYTDPPHPGTLRPASTYIHRNLTPNTTYVYRIRAFNGYGSSPYTYAECTTAPSTPLAPVVVRVGPRGLRLNWDPEGSVLRRVGELEEVFHRIDKDGSGTVSRAELLPALTKERSLLEFMATRRLDAGSGAGDDDAGSKTDDGDAAIAATSLFDRIETDDNEELTWQEMLEYIQRSGLLQTSGGGTVATGTVYSVLRSVEDTGSLQRWTEVYVGNAVERGFSSLEPGMAYRFRVQAINCEGIPSRLGNPVVVSTLLERPAAPVLTKTQASLAAGVPSTFTMKWPRAVTVRVPGEVHDPVAVGATTGGPEVKSKEAREQDAQAIVAAWARRGDLGQLGEEALAGTPIEDADCGGEGLNLRYVSSRGEKVGGCGMTTIGVFGACAGLRRIGVYCFASCTHANV